MVMRFLEAAGKKTEVSCALPYQPVARAARTDLSEVPAEELEASPEGFRFTIPPKSFFTCRIDPEDGED